MGPAAPPPSSAPRMSRRPIPIRRHLDGIFPDRITAHWCVQLADEHAIVSLDQPHVDLAGLRRPLSTPASSWDVGRISADLYFKVLASAEPADPIHNCVVQPTDGGTRHEPPEGLHASLYPYQLVGYRRIRSAVESGLGALLFDEMGLGKTLQAIAVMASRPPGSRHLVICPSSLIANWERELVQFAPLLHVQRHVGPERALVRSSLTADVTLTSYDTAVNDQRLLSKVSWDLLVLDEAQRIKNPEAGRTVATKAIPRRATICITGTPVENSLVDLWSITDGALPDLLGDLDDFTARFPDEFASAEALGEMTAPVTVRRSVDDVGSDLPPRVDTVVPVDATDQMMTVHREIVASEPGLVAATACRVLMAHAADDVGWDVPNSPKGEIVLTMLDAAFGRNEKVLVFASFQKSLDRLGEMIVAANSDAWVRVIDGRLPADQRQSTIDEFTAINGGAALLMNPQAAGVGLNVVAANHVIHFNPEWNPAVTAQATARAYRRRQERTVFVYHLYYLGTIEERAMARSSFKEQLADHVTSAAQTPEEDEDNV